MPARSFHFPADVPAWQKELAAAVRDPAELLDMLGLDSERVPAARLQKNTFPLRVPHSFIQRMEYGNPSDPLLRQVLPLQEELLASDDYLVDPVGDRQALKNNGILHKYHGRVLLLVTGACAIHCRYCFRQHFPYGESGAGDFSAALDHIRRDTSIREVILSGGDPLVFNDQRLAELAMALAAIPHLQRLRIHSRLPVVIPSRVDEHLLEWLAATHLQRVLVVHVNHPQELSGDVTDAMARLRGAGVILLNQTVLLAGINDHAETLATLSERLFAAGVLPYYLHALDKVRGAQHFNANTRLHTLMPVLQARLPGYLVPRAVYEEAGKASKTPVHY